jgi:hypothetical protein
MALLDVFETVIVPGGSRASLKVAKRLVWAMLPIWKAIRGRRHGLSAAFAPLVLVLCFVIWMALLALAFGLMSYAVRSDFDPPLKSFFDAVYIVGSSLVTVGLAESNPAGGARWVVLGAGFCGLGVMTMAVTYLLERRDTGIIKLNTSAGEPPSALTLLQRFAAIDNQGDIGEILREGRNWCATVRQSHANHPSLIYFQSVAAGSGWPSAMGALLDLSLLSEFCLDSPELRGPAVLLREEAMRMARDLAALIAVKPVETDGNELEIRQAADQLESAGYRLRRNCDFVNVAQMRADYLGCVKGLSDHLGKPSSVLVRQI